MWGFNVLSTMTEKGKEAAERKCSVELPVGESKDSQIYYARSLTLRVIDWYNVYIQVYVPVFFYAFSVVLAAKIINDLVAQNVDITDLVYAAYSKVVRIANTAMVTDAIFAFLVLVIVFVYLRHRKNHVYIVDFATFKAPDDWKVKLETALLSTHEHSFFSVSPQGSFSHVMPSGVRSKT